MCSSLFPQGYIIILEMRPGVPVTLFIEDLSLEEQLDLIYRTRYGIAYLQGCGFEVKNAKLLEDILFCRETRRTTLIDFVAMSDPGDWDFLDSQSNYEESDDERSWGSDETLVP